MGSVLLFVVGAVLLIVGAELIVSGASRVATILGVSPMVIGLTIVSAGTSTPEWEVGIVSATQGSLRANWLRLSQLFCG